jgi:hypothetical protein
MENDQHWHPDLDSALVDARSQGKAVLLQFSRDECAGCKKMDANTYAALDVQSELARWFITVRQDISKNRATRVRYSAVWTPSFYFLDHHGNALMSFNGYQGIEDFRILMRLGRAAVDLPRGRYYEVIDLMDDGLKLFPDNPRAATLLFTRGMAEYLLGKEKSSFRGAMTEILEQYPYSLEARMWPWSDRD